MKELFVGIIIAILGWFFLYLPVMGFAYLFLGEYALGLLYLIPLIGLIAVLLYRHFVTEPEKARMAALCRMYGYPSKLTKDESVDQWPKAFKAAIHCGYATTTESDKQTDLNYCQQIVEKMKKDNKFDDLHRAFRLTGCHMEIKDPKGNTVAKIV